VDDGESMEVDSHSSVKTAAETVSKALMEMSE
jgi:hypothetical protein